MSEAEKKEFPGMLALAEKAFLVSDDHAYYIDLMQYGYLNIALMRTGPWMSAQSLLEKAGDVFFLHLDELEALLRGEGGSPFDHPGIIAREMDIPAIYYTRSATKRLKDGEIVELDGFAGEVRVL